MKHRKQAYEQIERTIAWNTIRGNTPNTLDWLLEVAMLQEELNELAEAAQANDPVAIFDALMDIKFVLYGTCGKFSLSPEQIVDGYEAVILANDMKGTKKSSDGKITKPKGWEQYAPEIKLQSILQKRK